MQDLGRRWGHCAKQAGRALTSSVHCVGDGAEWIDRQRREVFGDQGSYLGDFFHVSEYLAAAAPRCRPNACDPWRKTQHKRLKRGARQLTIQELAEHLEPPELAEDQAPVRSAHRYLSNRTE